MEKTSFLFYIGFILWSSSLYSQQDFTSKSGSDFSSGSSMNYAKMSKEKKVVPTEKTTYKDYKIISHSGDTTYIDTTLTIQKEYKFNYLRKDDFELLPFHNQGQTFTNLGYSFDNIAALPDIGFRAKQFSYLTVEDIKYYDVPTPTSEITTRTGLEQGQMLDAIFTLNFSKRMNVALSYKGIRSLGKYRRSLASHGNFRTSFHYRTQKNQYRIKGHIALHDFFNQENGGLPEEEIEKFVTADPEFDIRARLDVNLANAENMFHGSRYYLEHDFKIHSSKDSLNNAAVNNIKVGHIMTNETKEFWFNQRTNTPEFFGEYNATEYDKNTAKSRVSNNQLFVEFNSKYILGTVRLKASLTDYFYGYDTILNSKKDFKIRALEGKAAAYGASWKANIKKFNLHADAQITPGNGRLSGNYFKGEAMYANDSVFTMNASVLLSSKSPDFNTLFHQSYYDDYNWQHNFDNVATKDLGISIRSKWIDAAANYTNIENYTYFDELFLPQQYSETLSYLKVKASREVSFWKFGLHNTLMYQKVIAGEEVFRVPEFVTRNTLYYSDYWFKGKPMQVQIGATFKYFTNFKANAYNPLIAAFGIQNDQEIGFPTVDVFFNAQIRRTRLFFKIENLTSRYTTPNNYFSAPNYPYRDFVIRFGLVWNWFN